MWCSIRSRVGARRRRSPWTSRPPSNGYLKAHGRCSCCMMSRAIVTRRSRGCSGSRPAPRSPSSTGRAWRSGSISSGEGEGTMSDHWTDRLSDYLDNELPAAERAELEAHLLHCVACGAVLADLKRIVTRARGLEDQAPDRDLWPQIAARIGAGSGAGAAVVDLREARPRRRWSFSLPQLAAAGIALMAVSGGTAWLLHPAA